MKQLTKDQAIKFFESKVWEHWTDEEIFRFQLFQDRLCFEFSRFHVAANKVLKRDVYTHEFTTSNRENLIEEYLLGKEPPTLDEIIKLIPKDKQLFIGF